MLKSGKPVVGLENSCSPLDARSLSGSSRDFRFVLSALLPSHMRSLFHG